MIRFCPLASGSKGNSYLLQTDTTTLLVDAGISMRELERRLAPLDCSLNDIDAIFITHEHHDHIAGLKTLTNAYPIPILANYSTAEAIVETIDECPKFKIFTTGEPFTFQDLFITPFSVQHDGIEPVGVTITIGKIKIGLCTDIGFMTKTVLNRLSGCTALLLESNHQPDFVHASSRPESYKRRVLSRLGHLSNQSCADSLACLAHPELEQVFLAHLSSECNSKEVALDTMKKKLDPLGITLQIDIAHQEIRSKEWSANQVKREL